MRGMPDTLTDRRSLGIVFAVALVCRGALFTTALSDPSRPLAPPDSAEYVTIAQNVAAGHGYSTDMSPPYRPDVRRTPIYPSLLAGVFLLGGGVRLASLLGVLAGAATVAATYWIAWQLFGSGAAFIGGLLLAVDATSVTYSGLILTEAIFTLFLVTGIAALLNRPPRPSGVVRGGVLLGCATLCRPAGLFLAPASLPVCAWRHAGRRAIARDFVWLNVVFAVIALVWVGRNAIVAGAPTLSSIGSVNLYFHRAAAVEARLESRTAEEVRAEWERRFESMSGQWTESAKLEWMTEHAREVIAKHPIVYLLTMFDGIVFMMQSDPSELCRVLGLLEGSAACRATGVADSLQLWIMYPAAVIGLMAAARDPERRRAALVAVTFIAYFILVAGPEAYARFRVPAMPFVAILSGVGIHDLLEWMRSRA